MTHKERVDVIGRIEREMKQAAKELNFEHAAMLRDLLIELKASHTAK
jgi:excinuclease ABC subunit B